MALAGAISILSLFSACFSPLIDKQSVTPIDKKHRVRNHITDTAIPETSIYVCQNL